MTNVCVWASKSRALVKQVAEEKEHTEDTQEEWKKYRVGRLRQCWWWCKRVESIETTGNRISWQVIIN